MTINLTILTFSWKIIITWTKTNENQERCTVKMKRFLRIPNCRSWENQTNKWMNLNPKIKKEHQTGGIKKNSTMLIDVSQSHVPTNCNVPCRQVQINCNLLCIQTRLTQNICLKSKWKKCVDHFPHLCNQIDSPTPTELWSFSNFV